MLLFWLSPVLFRPIMRLFDEREKRIDGAKAEAQAMQALAEEKARLFDQEYSVAKTSAREVLTKLKQEADKEQREHIDNARLEAKKMLALADQELLAEEKRVRSELSSTSAQVTNDIIKALMGQKTRKESL